MSMIAAMHPVSSIASTIMKEKRPNKNITAINIHSCSGFLLQNLGI